MTGIGSKLLNFAVPGLGTLAGKVGDYYYNHQGNPGGIEHSTFPTNPTMSVNDLGFSGYPSVSNPFTTSQNGYDSLASGDIFDPSGYFGHQNRWGSTPTNGGYAGGTAGTGHVAGGKTWLTGQDAQNWVEGQRNPMAQAQATLDFFRGNRRMAA